VAAPAAESRHTAQKALLALLESLDAWAGPLKVSVSSIEAEAVTAVEMMPPQCAATLAAAAVLCSQAALLALPG
jgi:hypothetical protein